MMVTIYLAVDYDGEGQGYYKTVRAFRREDHARVYAVARLAEDIIEVEVEQAAIPTRVQYAISWWDDRPDCAPGNDRPRDHIFANPTLGARDQEYVPGPVTHEWRDAPNGSGSRELIVTGWNLDEVRSTYQRLRAEHLAEREAAADV